MFYGYRNLAIVLAAIGSSAWIAIVGIHEGSDLVGLATVIGAKDAAAAAMIFGRGYNKKVEANGKNGGGA